MVPPKKKSTPFCDVSHYFLECAVARANSGFGQRPSFRNLTANWPQSSLGSGIPANPVPLLAGGTDGSECSGDTGIDAGL